MKVFFKDQLMNLAGLLIAEDTELQKRISLLRMGQYQNHTGYLTLLQTARATSFLVRSHKTLQKAWPLEKTRMGETSVREILANASRVGFECKVVNETAVSSPHPWLTKIWVNMATYLINGCFNEASKIQSCSARVTVRMKSLGAAIAFSALRHCPEDISGKLSFLLCQPL